MKSVTKFAYMSMLAAACLSCGCGGRKEEVRLFQPLAGKDALAVAVVDYGKMRENPSFRSFKELAEKKGIEFNEAMQKGQSKMLSEKLARYGKMTGDDFIREFYGVEPSDLKWSMWALEKFDPKTFAEDFPKNVKAPHMYAVLYSVRPLDLDKIVNSYGDLFKAICEADPSSKEAFANASEEISKVISSERIELDGALAYRFTLTDTDSGEKIGGISPIVTTINGGTMLVFALSDATLAHVKGLYDGTVPSASPDSAIGREMALPDNVLFRFAFSGINDFFKACMEAEGEDFDDDEEFTPADLGSARIDVGFDTAKDSAFLRAAADFIKAEQAADLAKEADEGLGQVKMAAGLMLMAQRELAWLSPVLQTLEVANSGNTLAAGFSIPRSAIESFDAPKMAEMILDAQKKSGAVPFGFSDDDDDDDEIE